MPRTSRVIVGLLSTAIVCTAGTLPAWAQSGSRYTPPRKSPAKTAAAPQRTQKTVGQLPVALEGYCPVCILKLRKWVKGSPDHQITYDGRVYYFPGEEQKSMFLSDPAKFVPALGGDCVVSLIEMGKRTPGNIRHASFRQDRLFLFANAEGKRLFAKDPEKYEDADLALEGNCPVCTVEMNVQIPGKPELTVNYGGLRYLFPTVKFRDMFLANPVKYVKGAAEMKKKTKEGSERR